MRIVGWFYFCDLLDYLRTDHRPIQKDAAHFTQFYKLFETGNISLHILNIYLQEKITFSRKPG